MKIVALSDVHGANQKVLEICGREKPDLLIIGGDLTTYGTVSDARKAVNLFRAVCGSMLCVSGNMDSKDHDEYYEGEGLSINGKGKIIGDMGFFGVSAAPVSFLRTPYEVSEETIASVIMRGFVEVAGARLKILVSHAPPEGTAVDMVRSGKHVGSKAVRQFIEAEHPDAVICGHIHEARGTDTIGSTGIVNCGEGSKGYYAVITPDGGLLKIENRQLSLV